MSSISRRKILAAAGAAAAGAAVGSIFPLSVDRRKRPKHVILVVVDALRADRLGCYGYRAKMRGWFAASLSPHLDRIADKGVLFEKCTATSSWTLASVPSILASRLPFVSGVRFNPQFAPETSPTLAQALQSRGYYTSAIVANPCLSADSPACAPVRRGFASYDLRLTRMVPNPLRASKIGARMVYERFVPAKELVSSAIKQLDSAYLSGRSAFIYLHLMETHEPYHAGAPYTDLCTVPPLKTPDHLLYEVVRSQAWLAKREQLRPIDRPAVVRARDIYKAAVRCVDDALGNLMDYLDDRDAGSETMLVVTSDHGEEFADHGWICHAITLYQECLHVPLVFRGAGVPRGFRVSDPVSSVDIAPTILAILGLPIPPRWWASRSI